MTDRPILFSAPMVRALLDGRKTQTRRIVKPRPPAEAASAGFVMSCDPTANGVWTWLDSPDLMEASVVGEAFRCPYGLPGDRLWVRESHQRFDKGTCDQHVWFVAGRNGNAYVARERPEIDQDQPWPLDASGPAGGAVYSVPSIHMPRWASRLTLAITEVRVERLQDIGEADAIAEGLIRNLPPLEGWRAMESDSWPIFTNPVRSYAGLWNHINGKGAWAANPWVWALTFRVEPRP